MKKITTKSKILCLCAGGNVRSVAMAFLFKMNGVDAVALGVEWNRPETITMMTKWADHVLVAQTWMKDYVPKRFHKKVVDMEIGEDRWGSALNKELLDLAWDRMKTKLGIK